MRGRCLVVVALTGCSFDAPPPANSPIDAAPDAPPGGDDGGTDCFAKWRSPGLALAAPVPLANLNSTAEDRDPFVSPDELVIRFASRRGGNGDANVFIAKRNTRAEDFSPPIEAEVNTNSDDTRMALTTDQLSAVLASDRDSGEGANDLWITTRDTTATQFTNPVQTGLGAVNDADDQQDPELTGDGLALYLAVGSPQRIVVARRTALTEPFPAPVSLIDSTAGDADPAVSPDETLIVFSSNRTGSGFGGTNIWFATRATKLDPFSGVATAVPDINTNMSEGDPVLSADGCRLYFAVDSGIAGYELVVSAVQ